MKKYDRLVNVLIHLKIETIAKALCRTLEHDELVYLAYRLLKQIMTKGNE